MVSPTSLSSAPDSLLKNSRLTRTWLEAKCGLASTAIEKQIECVLRAVDKKIGCEDRVKRAALTVVDGDCEAASVAHSLEQQPIIVAVPESSHMLRVPTKHVITLLFIMSVAVE